MTKRPNRAGGVGLQNVTCWPRPLFLRGREIFELCGALFGRDVSAKTAERKALHRLVVQQHSGLGPADRCAVRAAETVMRGLTTTDGIRASAAPRTAIGKPGHGQARARG
jgi:hypothetical protein